MTVRVFQYFLFITAWSLICSLVQADSLREYHQRKCNEGNQESCQKAEAMLQGEHLAERIVKLGDHFATVVNRLQREEDNKPILKNAYIDVLDDYFRSSSKKGKEQMVNDEIIILCAEHYHDYWRNRKMWWPTDEEGKPDWSTIYYYIVDHYYGYCLAISAL
jgi:hypothetical protein